MKVILKKPIITEKAIGRTSSRYYTFEIDRRANKTQVRSAVEALFNVDVEEVRTQTRPGTGRRVGRTRRRVLGSPTKRAIVRIAEGQTIDLFSIPTGEEKNSEKKKNTKDTK